MRSSVLEHFSLSCTLCRGVVCVCVWCVKVSSFGVDDGTVLQWVVYGLVVGALACVGSCVGVAGVRAQCNSVGLCCGWPPSWRPCTNVAPLIGVSSVCVWCGRWAENPDSVGQFY